MVRLSHDFIVPKANPLPRPYDTLDTRTIRRRQTFIKNCLLKGMSCVEAAHAVVDAGFPRISPRRVRELAYKRRLPTNAHIVPGGPVEREILRLHNDIHLPPEIIGAIYRQAPSNIVKVLRRHEIAGRSL